jgi:hypothetical protein
MGGGGGMVAKMGMYVSEFLDGIDEGGLGKNPRVFKPDTRGASGRLAGTRLLSQW